MRGTLRAASVPRLEALPGHQRVVLLMRRIEYTDPPEGVFTMQDGERARAFMDGQQDITPGQCAVCGGMGMIQPTRPATINGRVERVPAGSPRECMACRGKR